jgi:hypothetical protein
LIFCSFIELMVLGHQNFSLNTWQDGKKFAEGIVNLVNIYLLTRLYRQSCPGCDVICNQTIDGTCTMQWCMYDIVPNIFFAYLPDGKMHHIKINVAICQVLGWSENCLTNNSKVTVSWWCINVFIVVGSECIIYLHVSSKLSVK